MGKSRHGSYDDQDDFEHDEKLSSRQEERERRRREKRSQIDSALTEKPTYDPNETYKD